MRYSDKELDRLMLREQVDCLTMGEKVAVRIFEYIHTLKLMKQNFIRASFDDQREDEIPMTFQKMKGQLFGLATADFGCKTYKYIFNDKGFERLGELTELYDLKYRQKV